jgi:hypothetical protein
LAEETQSTGAELQAAGFLRTLKNLQRELFKSATKSLRTLGRHLRDDLREDVPQRSGRFAKSIGSSVSVRADEVRVRLSSNPEKAPYGKAVEHGTQLKPTTASKLAVPLPDTEAADAHGQAMFLPRELRDSPEAFGFEDSFVRNDTIFGVRHGQAIPLYVLRPGILMPRDGSFRGYKSAVQPKFKDAVVDAIAEGVEAARSSDANTEH